MWSAKAQVSSSPPWILSLIEIIKTGKVSYKPWPSCHPVQQPRAWKLWNLLLFGSELSKLSTHGPGKQDAQWAYQVIPHFHHMLQPALQRATASLMEMQDSVGWVPEARAFMDWMRRFKMHTKCWRAIYDGMVRWSETSCAYVMCFMPCNVLSCNVMVCYVYHVSIYRWIYLSIYRSVYLSVYGRMYGWYGWYEWIRIVLLCSKCFFAEYPVLRRTWKNWVANAFCFEQGLLRYRDYKFFKRRSIPRAFGVPCKWRWKIPTYSKKSSIMYFVWSSAIQWLQSMLVLRWKNEDWQKAS